jgi:Transposase DDE domain
MLDWEELLISICYKVCDLYEKDLVWYAQRISNNAKALEGGFLDVEAITLYIFGVIKNRRQAKEIHQYAKDHLGSWFPKLPSYQKFNERLNLLTPALNRMAALMMDEVRHPGWLLDFGPERLETVVDSMPIIMARGGRADSAKVALEIADKGRCSSKNLWYHGVKLHDLAVCRPCRMPLPAFLALSRASENDNTVFKEQIAPNFRNVRVFADKIYDDKPAAEELRAMYNIEVQPCQRRRKGQENLHSDQKLFSTMVSRARQPIESFFNWLDEKVSIQSASKVRSTRGLLKHVFGRLVSALFILLNSL